MRDSDAKDQCVSALLSISKSRSFTPPVEENRSNQDDTLLEFNLHSVEFA